MAPKKPSSTLPAKMAALGFEERMRDVPEIMFLAARAKEKEGKTWWSVNQVPEPIAFIDIDRRAATTIQDYQSTHPGTRIHPIYIENPTEQEPAIIEFTKFWQAWHAVLNDTYFQTMVTDTFGEIYDMARMAEFGKLEGVRSRNYGGINSTFNRLLDEVRMHNVNVILLHKMKERWANDQPTGTFYAQGFPNTPFKVDSNLILGFDKPKKKGEDGVFWTEIDNCGLPGGMRLAGNRYEGDEGSFAKVAVEMFPETDVERWGG